MGDSEDFYEPYRVSLHSTVKRCALLPLQMNVQQVVQRSITFIGGGGFSDVYRGRLQNSTGQNLEVALKLPNVKGTREQVQAILAVCQSLDHIYLVLIYI